MKYYLNNSYSFLQNVTNCGDNYICPQKLYIDITEDCNLFCNMCRDKISVCGKTMSIELFKKIIKETSPYVRSYSLFNWGEPLIAENFHEMVAFVNKNKRDDCIVEISTNGMLLSEEMTNFLFKQNVNIIISVDSADKNTFENIRRGSNFELIMKNAKRAAHKYSNFPIQYSPSFYISIQKANQNSILEIAELANSLGIRNIGCGIVTNPSQYVPNQDEKLCSELEKLYNYIEEHKMFLSVFPTKVGKYVFSAEKYYEISNFIVDTNCNAPFVSAAIGYSGDVFLCCNIGEKVGNVTNNSFLKLWQNQKYNSLRQSVNNKNNMPIRCKKCAWFNRN